MCGNAVYPSDYHLQRVWAPIPRAESRKLCKVLGNLCLHEYYYNYHNHYYHNYHQYQYYNHLNYYNHHNHHNYQYYDFHNYHNHYQYYDHYAVGVPAWFA